MPPHRSRTRKVLRVESLEVRLTPANFGVPWLDPAHLTLSFVPDGTSALGTPTSLYSSLDQQMPRADWQNAILRAAQTWSEVSGLNIGLVTDSGDALGISGASQGDARFGDIRVSALPIAVDLAVATPPGSALAGTLSGDVTISSEASFTPDSLYSVALHELGHAIGMAPSLDPSSVMFNHYLGNQTLSKSDIDAVQSLYGPQTSDSNEGRLGNGSIKNSTPLSYSGSFDGSTPLVFFGDVSTTSDVDIYMLKGLDTYSGPITVSLQTSGISLLTPRLSVMDSKGNVLATADGAGENGDTVTLTIPDATPETKYYLKVESAPGAGFSTGRYGVALTFDDRIEPTAYSVDDVLKGPFDTLKLDDIIKLFKAPSSTNFNDDFGRNDSAGTATSLKSVVGLAPNTAYKVLASISTPDDFDFYKVRAPSTSNNARVVLTATVRAVAPNGAAQRVELYDSHQVRIPATIIANGNGTFTVQAENLPSNTDYIIKVGGNAVGNYQLAAVFGSTPEVLQTFTTGSVDANQPVESTLYLAETQIFGFTLTANGPEGSTVELTFTDEAGHVVFSLAAGAGDTVSGVTGLLGAGKYSVRAVAVGSSAPVSFLVRGSGISDPIGPQVKNTAPTPQNPDPTKKVTYVYPDGTRSLDPFLWLVWAKL